MYLLSFLSGRRVRLAHLHPFTYNDALPGVWTQSSGRFGSGRFDMHPEVQPLIESLQSGFRSTVYVNAYAVASYTPVKLDKK